MDAAYDVKNREVSPAPAKVLETAESLREEIEATGRVLHEHIDELRERLQQRLDSLRNPFGVHDHVTRYPFAACGMALVAGVTLGLLQNSGGASLRIAQRFGAHARDTIAGQVASRFLSRMAGLG